MTGAGYRVELSAPDDFANWRDRARALLMAQIPPECVTWDVPGEGEADLFAPAGRNLPVPATTVPVARVPREFLSLAKRVYLHTDIKRFSMLYRVLWRLQAKPGLMDDATDPDIRRMADLARAVRRDIHKMRAFVRFRAVAAGDGSEHFVAWFEPQFHILRANAAFFVNRFTTMHWSILTPRGSLHWDGETLREGPPAARADAPGGDPAEALWRAYYASIFNPARLKIGAMLKEMPRRYWKNLPEAALIPELIAGAQAREARMIEAGSMEEGKRPDSLGDLAQAITACRRCPIGCNGTRAVAGEGPGRTRLMIVGEQPGDVEEAQGRPFIGPAGTLLRSHLEQAGINITTTYVTNAVKHFKFIPQGKRRLHQTPTAREIDICRWWLDGERALVQPRLILALGASAARGVLGRTVSVQRERGRAHELEGGGELWLTVHPSYLLRLKGGDEAAVAAEEERFAADLAAVANRLAGLAA